MFHHRTSGLPNVWLVNGYQWMDTDYGKAISFSDIEGLHAAIVDAVLAKDTLTGSEFRFLRKALDLSQTELGLMFGKSDQALALWEKGRGAPQWAQRVLRGLHQEKRGRAVRLADIFAPVEAKSGGRNGTAAKRLTFEKAKRGGWRLVATPARQRAARPKAAA